MNTINLLLLRFYKKIPTILFDALSIPIAWFLAFWFRYNLQPFQHNLTSAVNLKALLFLTIIQLTSFYYFRLHRGLWQFSSLNDVARIIKSVLVAVFFTITVFYQTSLIYHVPRSVLPLYAIIVTTLLCGGRLFTRFYRDKKIKESSSKKTKNKVLIIGAGQAGESLLRDLKRTSTYDPVGLIDDNPKKIGLEIHGIPVLGTTKELSDIIVAYPVDLIFIAIPSARSAVMRRIVVECERCSIPFRTLPSLTALASGFVQVNSLREVNIEDLLGRDQVELEWDKIAKTVASKRVLVTGGGGSIGSELCRQIVKLNPSRLAILDSCEYNLYAIEHELKANNIHIPLETFLVSVADSAAINFHFNRFRPEIVFHAAAYKHVPLLEHQIRSAAYNNILGTQIVAEASVAVKTEKFILISTDKAVNPTNIMGTTKRIAEIYCQNLNEHVTTQFITVRFGNVLGSAGSVIPLFQKQLAVGGPLTVTHPEIERYFMTIPEASQLILQAMSSGHGGEIFVLDMGDPIKISYLAEQIIHLSGKIPHQDIKIVYTGLRPGEKLFEELFHEAEELARTDHVKLFKAKFRIYNWAELTQTLRLVATACSRYNEDELQILIQSLVPEFNPQLDLVN